MIRDEIITVIESIKIQVLLIWNWLILSYIREIIERNVEKNV